MNIPKHLQSFDELIHIMAQLRSNTGCPWDREQTPATLKKHILEEAYELLEAIDGGDPTEICDELGDLLLQVVFQAQIFAETNQFSIYDVAQSISDKLKRRHPHIFSDASYEEHEQRWEQIKRQERDERGQSNSLQKRIPHTLPALKRATKLARKSSQENPITTIDQIRDQLSTLETLTSKQKGLPVIEETMSQILTNICRFSAATGLDPEELLRKKTTQLISEIDSKKEVY